MFKSKSFLLPFLSTFLFFNIAWADTPATMTTTSTTTAHTDAMVPPNPVQNKVFDSMVGEWRGNSNMMGKKMRDKVSIKWALNHQFLIVKLNAKGIDDPKMQYSGIGIFGVNENGKIKTWWFDDWGARFVSTGEGTFNDNGLTMTDGNAMFKEIRSFTMSDNNKTMTMHAKGSMKMQDKEMPFEETTVYKKHSL